MTKVQYMPNITSLLHSVINPLAYELFRPKKNTRVHIPLNCYVRSQPFPALNHINRPVQADNINTSQRKPLQQAPRSTCI
uniref:Les22 n=1 Tax=Arundo donax TaxID=35708 RepID=A0A0A9CEZ6_ARUDO